MKIGGEKNRQFGSIQAVKHRECAYLAQSVGVRLCWMLDYVM